MIFKNRQAVAEKLTFAILDFIALLCIKGTYYFEIKRYKIIDIYKKSRKQYICSS